MNVNSHDWTWQLTVKNCVTFELVPDAMLFVVTLLALAVKLWHGQLKCVTSASMSLSHELSNSH